MDEKKEFVLGSLDKQLVFTQLCREYGISTKTGYKWRERFLAQGYTGLEEESRKPKSRGKALEEWISVEFLRIKKKHEAWGAAKILNIYERNNPGKHVPARSTVKHLSDQRPADRAGYVHHRRKKRRASGERIQQRVVPEKPNEVWTVDFKGWWYTRDQEKVLTVRDEAAYMPTVNSSWV
ncbi:hypothetical protein FACS189493_6540 [Spirochaetia bacterium]|nr:hypothetical protein FACS189493_6540 [Spirochaetia bacterium]